jgi:hypothetical protein
MLLRMILLSILFYLLIRTVRRIFEPEPKNKHVREKSSGVKKSYDHYPANVEDADYEEVDE